MRSYTLLPTVKVQLRPRPEHSGSSFPAVLRFGKVGGLHMSAVIGSITGRRQVAVKNHASSLDCLTSNVLPGTLTNAIFGPSSGYPTWSTLMAAAAHRLRHPHCRKEKESPRRAGREDAAKILASRSARTGEGPASVNLPCENYRLRRAFRQVDKLGIAPADRELTGFSVDGSGFPGFGLRTYFCILPASCANAIFLSSKRPQKPPTKTFD